MRTVEFGTSSALTDAKDLSELWSREARIHQRQVEAVRHSLCRQPCLGTAVACRLQALRQALVEEYVHSRLTKNGVGSQVERANVPTVGKSARNS
jgi:hypothetical protein